MSPERSEMAVTALREVAGPRLYVRNAFRITGLPTAADRKTARRRQRQVLPALEAGADLDLGHSLKVGPEEVRGAFDRILESPHRRLVDELFWLWGTSTADCGCARGLHRDHDEAVGAHSAALDLAADGTHWNGEAERLWSTAREMWGKALRRAAFWDHVRARIGVLDERQLDESVVDTLRDELPLVLLQPLIDLVGTARNGKNKLAEQARSWPGVSTRLVDDRLEDAAAAEYDAVDKGITEAAEALGADKPDRAASVVYQKLLPRLRELETVVPHRRHRRTARLRDMAALVLNNCATILIERDGPAAGPKAGKWLTSARELASDPQAQQTIAANRATLDQTVEAFQMIETQVRALVAAGRSDVARVMLLDVKGQLRGGAGTAQIDKLLATLTTSRPSYGAGPSDAELLELLDSHETRTRPTYRPSYRRSYRRKYRVDPWRDFWFRQGGLVRALLYLAPLIAIALYWFWPIDDERATGTFFAERIEDNMPAGTCIASASGWRGDKASVPVVRCDQPHWGEVLGYPSLGPTPSPYPGEDQVAALAQFECGLLLANQGQNTDGFTTTFVYPDAPSWNTNGGRFQNYATCVVHRIDNKSITGGRWSDPGKKVDHASVSMDLYGAAIHDNAPVGTCVENKPGEKAPLTDLPIVRCDEAHWAQVIGYPVLYEPGSAWPGDNAVYATAAESCQKLAAKFSLPATYHVNVRWPAKDWWQNPKQPIYAACTVSRVDDQKFFGAPR